MAQERVETRLLTERDIEAVARLCGQAFGSENGREPMCRSQDVTIQHFYDFTHAFVSARHHQQLSSVVTLNDEVVACVCAEEQVSPPVPGWDPASEMMIRLGPVLGFLDIMDLDLPTDFNSQPNVHVLLIASAVPGRGFAKMALDHAHHLARTRGMRGSYAECTGPISQNVFAKAGYACVRKYPYEGWAANNDPDVARGHCELRTLTFSA